MTDNGGKPDTLRRPMELGQIIDRSITLYRTNFAEFLAIAAITLPVDILNAIISAAVEDAVAFILASLPLFVLSLFVTVIATAALARAVDDIADGRPPDFNRSYRHVLDRLRALLLATLRAFGPIFLAAVTIVGIPLAIYLLVRWAFFPQAVIIDGRSPSEALSVSARIVKGQWWRTFGILLLVSLLASLPAIAVGMLFASAATIASGLASAVVAVIVLPFIAGGSTLLYFDLRSRERERAGIA